MRLLDLGTVPWLQSQSIHHAIAQAFDDDAADTLVVVRPDRPYLCVGPHQIGAALSRAAVHRSGLPVVRRRLGGGTVLVTSDQTFFVFIVHRRRMPLPSPAVEDWCLRSGVAAYRRLGVEATLSGSEIVWRGRKLCGSGSATIGHAAVFGCNIIRSFDAARFVEVLRMPSRMARDVLTAELDAQMGSVATVTGRRPSPEGVARAIRAGVIEACGVDLVPGHLSDRERDAIGPVEGWLLRGALRPEHPSRRRCWKVRSGSAVLGLLLERPWRVAVLVVIRDRRITALLADRRSQVDRVDSLRSLLVGASIDALSELGDDASHYRVDTGEPLLTWLSRAVRTAT